MDQVESDDRNIFVACDADAHLLHAVTHFFGQRAGQGPVVPYGLNLFVVPGDDLVKVHWKLWNW